VIRDKKIIAEIPYPAVVVIDYSKESLKKLVNIAWSAEVEGVHVIKTTGQSEVYAFKDKRVIPNILLIKYLKDTYDQQELKSIYVYAVQLLMEYPAEDIRGGQLRYWLLYKLPDKYVAELKPIEDKNSEDGRVDAEAFYKRRLEHVTAADNLAEFDQWYTDIVTRGTTLMQDVMNSKEFKGFCKKEIKLIEPFKMDVAAMFVNEELQPRLIRMLEQYGEELKAKRKTQRK
jgi:hypothetical protein